MTRNELASKVGVNRCHLKCFEIADGKSSKSKPKLHIAYKIANALQVSVYDVFPDNESS